MEHEGRPIHRWLEFPDSWSVADVAELLAELDVRPGSLVCDPFVGCGTTAVVCAARAIPTACADISPLAALATRTKLRPPSPARIAILEERLLGDDPDTLLRAFASPPAADEPAAADACFVIAAALWRSQPAQAAPFDLARFHAELSLLLQEMSQDVARTPLAAGDHLALCSDFRRLSPARVNPGGGPVHVISSPPFFGSNRNPWQARLDDYLRAIEPCDASPPELFDADQLDVSLPMAAAIEDPELRPVVDAYVRFIDALVSFISALGCRSVALEIGPGRIGDVLLPFDHYLAAGLSQAGFRNPQIHARPHSTDLISVITARN